MNAFGLTSTDLFFLREWEAEQILWLVIATGLLVFLISLYIWDRTQRKHTILRNYPVLGHFRYVGGSIYVSIFLPAIGMSCLSTAQNAVGFTVLQKISIPCWVLVPQDHYTTRVLFILSAPLFLQTVQIKLR